MKQGKTLNELAREVQRQSATKIDRLYSCEELNFGLEGDTPVLWIRDCEAQSLADTAHKQVGAHLNIPVKYYDKMLRNAPQLLIENLNYWFWRDPSRHVIRMLDGRVRAFLSQNYKRIDNDDILAAVAPILGELGELSAKSFELTESRMYIKVVTKKLTREVAPGDIVQAGVCITNSEVGLGGFNAHPLIYRLVCSNGMVVEDMRIRAIHRGPRLSTAEDYSIYQPETIFTENKSIVMKAVDMVRAALDEKRFEAIVGTMRQTREVRMNIGQIPDVVENTAKEYQINDEEKKNILEHLIEDGDFSLYGLSCAVTRTSQDVQNYDRATKLESIGWKILNITPKKWNELQAV